MLIVGSFMELRSFVLCNASGDEVCISNYGARILQWHTQVGEEHRNIVLGYSSLSDYQEDPFYLGAIAGPYANRIGGATVQIDDQLIELNANEGSNQLHGGENALSDVLWEVDDQEEQSLTLSCELEDGFNGYPGPIKFVVSYNLTDECQLDIVMSATTEQATIIGPTSHPYFNLAGEENSSVGHMLQLFSDHYTAIDDKNIPTGELTPVEGTMFDFRQPRTLITEPEHTNIDHNFACSHQNDKSKAILISPDKKLQLHVKSSYPGMQVYTGHYLAGKFEPRQGICLEPQFYPNSPNVKDFPFYITRPEQPFREKISYSLVKIAPVENDNENENESNEGE